MVSRYGIVGGNEINPNVYRINKFIEKPDPEKLPPTWLLLHDMYLHRKYLTTSKS